MAFRGFLQNAWSRYRRPLLVRLSVVTILIAVTWGTYFLWSPGLTVCDGRHDLKSNGIWLQHGWLGDDRWFVRNQRDRSLFRNEDSIRNLVELLKCHGIQYVFPHVCPCDNNGQIARIDDSQAELFLGQFEEFDVIPWIGGVLDVHCFPGDEQWRARFVESAMAMLERHPRMAGVHVNIEPLPSGNPGYLMLLKELREAMPDEKVLSIAAYPPPTLWHPHPEVHWDELYYRQVAQHADQIVPMMYDTSIRFEKVYRHVMAAWTEEILAWTGRKQVLLGVPAYDDVGSGYHRPDVENLRNALSGIHAALAGLQSLPAHYSGIAIYSEWEMDPQEWTILLNQFEGSGPGGDNLGQNPSEK